MKKSLSFIKNHPSFISLVVVNIIIAVALIDLGSIALIGEAKVFCQKLHIAEINSLTGRSLAGVFSLILLAFGIILNANAFKFYKNPEEYQFKDEL